MAAADLAAIGFDLLELQAAAREDARIGVVHDLVILVQPCFVSIKGIAILHDKFTAAHEAQTGTDFVAVFILHLPERKRQLLIGTQFITDERRNQFFMCRSQAVLVVVAVRQFEHFRAIGIPAA